MKVLGIESAAGTVSVALVTDGILTAEYTVNHKKTHSQTLMLMLDEICKMTGLDRGSLDAVAVSSGPGSFTGLRIGAATAKGIGMALRIPLIAVPTLAALAYNFWGTSALICPLMDARRGQVYQALYRCENRLETVQEARIVAASQLVRELEQRGERVLFAGDGETALRSALEQAAVHLSFDTAPASLNRHRAGSVAALGSLMLSEGRTVSAAEFTPNYLKASQAEREHELAVRLSAEKELAAGIVPKGVL